jgi:hypothetical protein
MEQGHTPQTTERLNACRQFLQAVTLADSRNIQRHGHPTPRWQSAASSETTPSRQWKVSQQRGPSLNSSILCQNGKEVCYPSMSYMTTAPSCYDCSQPREILSLLSQPLLSQPRSAFRQLLPPPTAYLRSEAPPPATILPRRGIRSLSHLSFPSPSLRIYKNTYLTILRTFSG